MVIPYSAFSVTKEDGKITFAAELSEFNGKEIFHRVYDDACDQGIYFMGKHSLVEYVVCNEQHDNDGDLQYYRLVPSPKSYKTIPGCRNTEVILFND